MPSRKTYKYVPIIRESALQNLTLYSCHLAMYKKLNKSAKPQPWGIYARALSWTNRQTQKPRYHRRKLLLGPGAQAAPLLWSLGSPIWRAPPNFCDVILSKLCFNCSHWFYAMPTNRQLDNSFPVVLDIFGKGLNLPAPLDWPKRFQLQGAKGLCPWTPLGALPPDPRYSLMLRTLHSATQPLTPSAAYDPRASTPPTYFDKFTPMHATPLAM